MAKIWDIHLGSGPEQVVDAANRRTQRRPARHLHRPIQRGGAGRGVPSPRWRGVRPRQAGLAERTKAEDVTQEVFLRLWNQPDRFDPDRGSLRSFLLAQAHGRAVDAVRSSTRGTCGSPATPCGRPTPPMTCSTRCGTWPSPTRSPGHGRAARGGAAGDWTGVLRRTDLPRGRPAPRPARGHGEEPDPQRHAPHARRPLQRRGPRGERDSHEEASELLGVRARCGGR